MVLIRVQARTKMVRGYISCMRGTWLGNPFPLTKYCLYDSLRLYHKYICWRIENDQVFYDYLEDLKKRSINKDITLGCTCKPKDECHVDILIRLMSSK